MTEEKKELFAVPVDYIYDILDEALIQADMSKNLLIDVIQQDISHNDILSLVTEILYTNLTISRLTEKEVITSYSRLHPETDEEEYILSNEIMITLQSLLLSKYYATQNLSQVSYSLSLH